MRTVGIGIQDFETIRENNLFYIDKTDLIKEWWESGDSVTLIARPRRFGKTLTMDMLDKFFSVKYAGRKDLFENLEIWQEEKYQELQGTYPVIFLTFANVKEQTYEGAKNRICQIIADLYLKNYSLIESGLLKGQELEYFKRVSENMTESDAVIALNKLCEFLQRYYGKKVIILLDEYDTPMQEAYVDGYWNELVSFMRSMFNATFKTNPYLERAIMTGITRVSKESIFSDLNNLKVVTTTSNEYADKFGFTEKEVFAALEEQGLSDRKEEVKRWYDGFIFGNVTDMYNPWSIINYLDTGKLAAYWANTSSNSLVNTLIREGGKNIKQDFETLMTGGCLKKLIDEQIVFNQLSEDENAIWSLLLASGYLKVQKVEFTEETAEWEYFLALTNKEVYIMFRNMVRGWFARNVGDYNDFIKALLKGDLKSMNAYMNRVALYTFSFLTAETIRQRKHSRKDFIMGLCWGLW